MDTPTQNRFEKALMQEDGLIDLAWEMKQEGLSQRQIYDLFMAYHEISRATDHSEEKEDAFIDSLDCISGWCSEHAKLFPDENFDWS